MKTGLPKQFARLGFKKGWAAFKKFRGSKGAFNTKKAPKTVKVKTRSKPKAQVIVAKKGPAKMADTKKVSALKSRLSGALKRAKGAIKDGPGEGLLMVGEGVASGIASAYIIGAIPVPAGLPKPGLIKSLIQTGAGIGLMFVKNKHARYAGAGMAIVGLISTSREFLPVPTFAGEVDAALFGESFDGDEFMGEDGQVLLGYDTDGNAIMGDPMMGDPMMGDPLMGSNTFASPY